MSFLKKAAFSLSLLSLLFLGAPVQAASFQVNCVCNTSAGTCGTGDNKLTETRDCSKFNESERDLSSICSSKCGATSQTHVCSTGLIQSTNPEERCRADAAAGAGATHQAIQLQNPLGVDSVPELIGNVARVVLGTVGALALLMFVYGGFTWLTSGGAPDKIKQGRDIMIWASIGLIVILSSYTLVQFVLNAFSS